MPFRKIEENIRDWMERHADTGIAQVWLSLVAFFEASILPFPPSAFMVTMIALGTKRRWVYLSLLATLFSVLGGMFGYLVGSVLYDTLGVWIVEKYSLADEIARVGVLFEQNAFWSIFVGAFTPIPYRAFTIGAGFFRIDLAIFTIASFLGRGLRFVLLAYFANIFGKHIAGKVFGFFTAVTLLAVAVIVMFALWSS